MACQVMHIWTFTDLVAAFLDLFIAYLLLSASFIVFFTSKFLAIFGLCLPCPCNGQFGQKKYKYCLQKNLIDCPIEKVSSVQFSVKKKLPFDSIFAPDQCFRDTSSKKVDRFAEFEGEGSCNRISDNGVESGALSQQGLKGNNFMNERSRAGIRRCRKGSFDYGKGSSVSSFDPVCVDSQSGFESISSINKEQNEKIEARRTPVYSGHDEGENPMVMKLGFDGDEEKTQIFLEQALQEEQAARAALYIDLEKERNAAATAADEAMAMIMRLQQEKAAVEMEAKHYQRLIEEKTAYDEEEMNILKEILIRRETETHYLEKEVEAYRQMGYGYTDPNPLLDPFDDPVPMLHRLNECIDKKESIRNVKSESGIMFLGKLEEQSQSSKGSRDLRSNKSTDSQEYSVLEKTIPILGKSEEQSESSKGSRELRSNKSTEYNILEKTIPIVEMCNDSKESRVLDVHVVDDNDYDAKRINRASSDMSVGLPPRGKMVISRRSSMSALDSERLKIENEVGWLRERLKNVQQGREKLNFSVDYKEREKLQLQLLDDITRQLQEIRQLTEKTSLPPLSSKAMLSKNRRCRSASLGVQRSS